MSRQHHTEIAAAEAEESRRAEERAKRREEHLKQQEEADEAFRRWKPYLIFIGMLAVIGFCYLIYLGVQNEAAQTRIEQQRAAEAKRKHEALLAPINAMFASDGVGLGDNANEPGADADKNLCVFTTSSEQSKKIVGKAAHFVTATYPPNKTVGDVRLSPSGEWLSEGLDKGLGLDEEWLFSNKRTGTSVLVTAHDETNYQASASDLTFRTKVHLCVGKPVDW